MVQRCICESQRGKLYVFKLKSLPFPTNEVCHLHQTVSNHTYVVKVVIKLRLQLPEVRPVFSTVCKTKNVLHTLTFWMDLRDLKVKTHGTFDLGEEKYETQLLNQLSRGKKRILCKIFRQILVRSSFPQSVVPSYYFNLQVFHFDTFFRDDNPYHKFILASIQVSPGHPRSQQTFLGLQDHEQLDRDFNTK